jgi:hypothetical protein
MKPANKILISLLLAGCFCLVIPSCHVYKFKDVGTVDPRFKTIKVSPFLNQARYVNPQLTPRLTDAFLQKITRQTRLTRTNNDDAHYQVSGYISQYDVTTAGVSSQQAATNRLTVGIHVVVLNTLDNKTDEYDVSRNFDFAASLTLPQAESQLLDDIIRNMSDEIFNRIFSNW